MQLTSEQQEIINTTGNIKINAVAGSGKTTTIIEYAKVRPQTSRILYLAFNRSVKLEATKKFAERGLHNVKVETAHSLAFRHIVPQSNYTVRGQGYKTNEIAELLELKGSGEKHAEYIVANHINKFIAYFCNSDKQKVQDINYLDTVSDPKAVTFVKTFYDYIEKQTRLLLSKMDKGEIEIIHDFYLKKFQLLYPRLEYDYILFDEGQDASAAMLDIFLRQSATKVIVGDANQQIYLWRHAVNSLEKVDFKEFNLSTSFRFGQDIADLAVEVLKLKKYIGRERDVTITGGGRMKESGAKAVLARTNLGLLLKAIEYVTEKKKLKHIYFEGNISSYTYADEGASLYDVLHLYNYRSHLIKDKLIKTMKDIRELEDYINKTEDVQLGMMVEIVKKYGNEIPNLIRRIKQKHVENNEKDKAEIVFSTVHRCKGMEYDAVQLVDDFVTEEKLKKISGDRKKEILEKDKLNEEINLLYVGITRAKNVIYIPETLLPKTIQPSDHIRVIKVVPEDLQWEAEKDYMANAAIRHIETQLAGNNSQAYSVEKVREKHRDAYKPWTNELDEELTIMYCEGVKLQEMAKHFGRTQNSIRKRIKKLELEDLYG